MAAIVRAAGGLLWREDPSGFRVAVVHRPGRNDWSLPKGKLDDGESWEAAALREVREETGCEARITGFAGTSSYLGKRAPKIVLYWHMVLVREGRLEAGEEIDEVAWLTPAAAIARLHYELDRRLLARAPPGGVRPAGAGPVAAAVADARADALRRILALRTGSDPAGLGPALELLDLADGAAARGEPEEMRRLVAAARRLLLLSAPDVERPLLAGALRDEARRLEPWRRRAIRGLLPASGKASGEALYFAAAIRDEADEHGRPAGWWRLATAVTALAVAIAVLAALRPAGPILAGALAGLVASVAGTLATLSAVRRRWPRR